MTDVNTVRLDRSLAVADLSLEELHEVRQRLEEEMSGLARENKRLWCNYRQGAHVGKDLEDVRRKQRVVHDLLLSVNLRIKYLDSNANKSDTSSPSSTSV